MKNLRVPIKIATKKDKVGGIEYSKFRKFAILQNAKMASQYHDNRPLKPQAYIKLKSFLEPPSFRALEKIVAGEALSKGTKLAQVEPIIRFLLIELRWREGQPSGLNVDDISLSMSRFESTQSEPATPTRNPQNDQMGNETMGQFWLSQNNPGDPSAAPNVTNDSDAPTVTKDSQGSVKTNPKVSYTSDESVEQILNESQREFLLTQNGPDDHPVASAAASPGWFCEFKNSISESSAISTSFSESFATSCAAE